MRTSSRAEQQAEVAPICNDPLRELSVRDAQTKLLCTGRMHPRCVRPTTGTILFNFNTKEEKRRVVAAHAV